jgi:2-deoxy-D-gluconate 3-dehydrogenase
MTKLFDLTGKVALVLGAAGMLGEAQALGLASAGADIVLADVFPKNTEATISAIQELGSRAIFQQVDIRSPESVEALTQAALAEFGKIDILINSAGITHRYPSEEFDDQVFDRILDINLHGMFYTCQSVGKVMKAQGGGRIINMASVFAFAGNPESIAYAASKGAAAQLTRTLAVEWAEFNIAVNGIAPSWFETPMGTLSDNIDSLYKGSTRKPTKEELFNRTIGKVPLKRMGQPHEIIGATVFLASAEASMVTGHLLAVDGGFLAQ